MFAWIVPSSREPRVRPHLVYTDARQPLASARPGWATLVSLVHRRRACAHLGHDQCVRIAKQQFQRAHERAIRTTPGSIGRTAELYEDPDDIA